MKRILALLVFTVTAFWNANAQDFQGMAVYESKTTVKDFKMEGREMTEEMKKMIEERMKKMLEKTFILYFDKTSSIYEEEQKLDAPGVESQSRRMFSAFTGGGGTHYKNVKDKTFSIEKEMMGKEFLVKDSLPKLDWKITGETKKIGNYLCFKATATQKPSKTDFRNFRQKDANAKKDEKEKTDKPKTTNFMEQGEIPDSIDITAWYTPEIPVNQGPENYWGLPGLILEVNAEKTTILCSKIVLNPKDKKEIKAPTKGKAVTQAEFDDIVMKKMQEMQEMYQGQGRGNGNIRFGG